jgi:Spy/CpxP family protein refolding chaperone
MRRKLVIGTVVLALGLSLSLNAKGNHNRGFESNVSSSLSESRLHRAGHHGDREIFTILMSDDIALTDDQLADIETIRTESRTALDDLRDTLLSDTSSKYIAFSNNSFDKELFITNMVENHKMMLEIKASTLESIIALLTDEQKATFYTQIDELISSSTTTTTTETTTEE